ncbi:MAG: IS3 family transposase [Pirellulaceae bacterium]
MTRQNYYKQRRRRRREQVDERLVVELIARERALQPHLGGRKLLHMLRAELAAAGVKIGRDRFFEVLRRHDLLVKRKSRSVRTTDSRHGFRAYENLLRDVELTYVHQAWMSDITYIRTDEGFLYLSLVMDGYSRAIVGFDCSDTLEREGALRALDQALSQRPCGVETIHHSDRGSQYCCGDYVERLAAAGVSISMTQEHHCYENAHAERLNGILKQEYGLGGGFRTKAQAVRAVNEAVRLYNRRRPHQALGYRTPQSVHAAA